MEKKNDIVSSLTGSVKTKKHITTKIEYFCNDSEDAERVFEKVTEVLSDNIDDFAKITYDYNAGENKVDVEVIEHVQDKERAVARFFCEDIEGAVVFADA